MLAWMGGVHGWVGDGWVGCMDGWVHGRVGVWTGGVHGWVNVYIDTRGMDG